MSSERAKAVKRPTQKQYDAAEINLALSIVNIKPCGDCGWPHVSGYVCQTYGSTNP